MSIYSDNISSASTKHGLFQAYLLDSLMRRVRKLLMTSLCFIIHFQWLREKVQNFLSSACCIFHFQHFRPIWASIALFASSELPGAKWHATYAMFYIRTFTSRLLLDNEVVLTFRLLLRQHFCRQTYSFYTAKELPPNSEASLSMSSHMPMHSERQSLQIS